MEAPESNNLETPVQPPLEEVVQNPKKPLPKKLIIIAVVSLLVLAGVIIALANRSSKTPDLEASPTSTASATASPTATPTPTATVVPTAKTETKKDTGSEADNSMGQDDIISADMSKDGPWKQSLQISESKDGKTFGSQKLFQKGGGVATAIRDGSGVLYAAFQYFPENDPQNFDKIAIKKSTDDGVTWTAAIPAVFTNYPKSFSRPFDPTLTLTPEGKIRMYYTVNTSSISIMTKTTGTVAFYSSISSDGITYDFEEGKRLAVDGKAIIDSAAAFHDGVWYILASTPKDFGEMGIYYTATSTDGLTFTTPTLLPTTKGYEWTGNMATVGTALRFYGSGTKTFYSEAGKDGKWGTPVNTNVGGADPAIVGVSSSKYLAIFSGPSLP